MPACTRLAVVTSHPIQYQGPLFQKLARHPEIDLSVLFCCEHGVKDSYDAGFDTKFAWERPLTEGYAHEFVPSIHPKPTPWTFWPRTNPGLWRRLTKRRFDAVLLVGWGFASCWIALAAARAHGLPVLLRAESHQGGHGERPLWKRTARRLALDAFFRNVDAFLAIGSRNGALYRAHGIEEERIFLAPYAVDNDFFLAAADGLVGERTRLREAFGVRDDGLPIVVSCGKLTERKAPMDLLRAFARVRRQLPAKLVFLGDGPQRELIEATAREDGISDDVVITGFRQQAELSEVYVAADLFAFPTHFETWGLVLNEAMLFGLPVICTTEVPAHDDLVVAGETGDVYPVGDVDALADLLAQRLSDPAQLRRMGASARRLVEGWSFDRCVEATIEALRLVGAG